MKKRLWIKFFFILGILITIINKQSILAEVKYEKYDTRPFKKIVEVNSKKDLDDRIKKYIEISNDLKIHLRFSSADSTCIENFIKEIILQNDFYGLELLEENLVDISKKKAVWRQTSYYKDNEDYLKLLKKWALKNLDAVELFCFQPDAENMIIKKIKENKISLREKCFLLHTLANNGNFKILPLLQELSNDSTPVSLINAYRMQTMGEFAQKAIKLLKLKETKNP